MPPDIELRGERKEGELGISSRIFGRMASYLLEWKEEKREEVVGVNDYDFYGVAFNEEGYIVEPVCHACLETKSGSFYYRLIPSEENPLILIVCSDCENDREKRTKFSFQEKTVTEQLKQDPLFRFKPLEMGALEEGKIRESGESLLESAQEMTFDVYPISEEERRKIVERVEKEAELLYF